jgi:N-acyl-D-amino-acid deacylase
VTTVIGGQDGVSYAPGDGAYASEYFAAINGPHPSYRGGGIGALLAATTARRR